MKTFRVFLVLFMILSTALSVAAQNLRIPSASGSLSANESSDLEGVISLDLRNIDIVEALKFLAVKSTINIVTTKAVQGRVTLRVEDASIQDVFDVMLRSNNLAYEKRDNIYNIMTEIEYTALYGKTFADVRVVKIVDLNYAIPEQIFYLCDILKSDIGRVLVNQEAGKVVIMDSPDKIKQLEEAIRKFENRNTIRVFTINYANAIDVADQLSAHLGDKKLGMVRADERTNQVIVQTLPGRMKDIEKLVVKLDRKTREVLIEAKIIQVIFNKSVSEEVEWEGLFDLIWRDDLVYAGSYPFSSIIGSQDPWRSRQTTLEGGRTADGTNVVGVNQIGSYPFSGTTDNVNASLPTIGLREMHIGMVGQHDFDVILKVFQDIGETNVLSTPKITVTNNQ